MIELGLLRSADQRRKIVLDRRIKRRIFSKEGYQCDNIKG